MSLVRPRRVRSFAATHSDLLLALVLALPIVGSVVFHAAGDNQPFVLVLAVIALAAIVLRSSRPPVALALAVAAEALMPDNRALLLPVLVVLYSIAARTPRRTAATAGAGAAIVAIIGGAASGSAAVNVHAGLLGYAIGNIGSYAAAVAAGLYVGARRRVLEGLRERAERLDRERELLADRAVAQERVRIAQELHDIVAHHVSLMVVQAQALGATVADERVAQSTDAIADLGRQAMTEMHATLKLLRGDEELGELELTPQPGLSQLGRLIEESRGAGLEIELTVEGKPRLLAQGIDLSAFRIVQEALTNVVKHAPPGASTKVTLAYRPQGMELTIIDSGGEAQSNLLRAPADGHGLIGMRERAALFGGTLTAEPLSSGFKITATLPYEPTAS